MHKTKIPNTTKHNTDYIFIIQKGEDTPLVDHIVCVCCSLTNVCNSVVPFEQL